MSVPRTSCRFHFVHVHVIHVTHVLRQARFTSFTFTSRAFYVMHVNSMHFHVIHFLCHACIHHTFTSCQFTSCTFASHTFYACFESCTFTSFALRQARFTSCMFYMDWGLSTADKLCLVSQRRELPCSAFLQLGAQSPYYLLGLASGQHKAASTLTGARFPAHPGDPWRTGEEEVGRSFLWATDSWRFHSSEDVGRVWCGKLSF